MDEKRFREVVWQRLITYIETQDLFFPFKIKQMITEDAHKILDDFVNLMLENKMLVEFHRKNITNRMALWFFKFKLRKNQQKDKLLEVYVKGPKWEASKNTTYYKLAGLDDPEPDTIH